MRLANAIMGEKRKKASPQKKAEAAAVAYQTAGAITDPLGSYTGNPVSSAEGGKIYMRLPVEEKPVQDADDL